MLIIILLYCLTVVVKTFVACFLRIIKSITVTHYQSLKKPYFSVFRMFLCNMHSVRSLNSESHKKEDVPKAQV